ncbi:MAG: hypothetical protein HZA93_28675 [Verrucomicrobia bacterium]|nr:hypothetical protein [Verrucomicrobiota bacterium]
MSRLLGSSRHQFLVATALVLTGCVNPAWEEFPEFATFKKQATGRFIGCLGYSLEVPGYENFLEKHSVRDAFVIPGTSDNSRSDEDDRWNARARAFARRHNAWLRKQLGE